MVRLTENKEQVPSVAMPRLQLARNHMYQTHQIIVMLLNQTILKPEIGCGMPVPSPWQPAMYNSLVILLQRRTRKGPHFQSPSLVHTDHFLLRCRSTPCDEPVSPLSPTCMCGYGPAICLSEAG
jgi:hypothetical protein